uniref:Uncharacterized protein n=1 Tax=Romanomermis culicivorax TaxID=13658 RepID=A0A915JGI1_ROMCU
MIDMNAEKQTETERQINPEYDKKTHKSLRQLFPVRPKTVPFFRSYKNSQKPANFPLLAGFEWPFGFVIEFSVAAIKYKFTIF